jgi:hypothetical protein
MNIGNKYNLFVIFQISLQYNGIGLINPIMVGISLQEIKIKE